VATRGRWVCFRAKRPGAFAKQMAKSVTQNVLARLLEKVISREDLHTSVAPGTCGLISYL